MKRVISFFLAAAMLLCLCGFGSRGKAEAEAALTKDMLIGKTFTSGRLGVTAEQEPELSIAFDKDGKVDWDANLELYWSISDKRVLFSSPIGRSSSYLYRDGYLIAENSCVASNGIIPEGDNFKAQVTVLQPYFGSKMVFSFEEDGTYSARDGDERGEGTYIREGNLIKIYDTNAYGEQIIAMYLYYAGENEIYNMVLFPEE